MISPFKAVIGDSYKAVEKRLLAAIHLRFGLPAKLPEDLKALIKAADRSAAYLEATRLAGFAEDEARKFFGPPPKFSAALERDYLEPLAGRDRASSATASVSKSCCGRKPFHRGIQIIHMMHRKIRCQPHDSRLLTCSPSRHGRRDRRASYRDPAAACRPRAAADAYRAGEPSRASGRRHRRSPMDGYTAPGAEHVQQLIDFVSALGSQARRWWCIASPASAARRPPPLSRPARSIRSATKMQIAWDIRRASRTAQPNARIVSIADRLLEARRPHDPGDRRHRAR